MDLIPINDYSQVQIQVCQLKLDKLTYRNILNLIPQIRFLSQIRTCLFRSAQGYTWDINASGGTDYYLCRNDEESLSDTIRSSIQDLIPLGIIEIVDLAYDLKISRIKKGVDFLKKCNCNELSKILQESNIEPPSKQWVQLFSKRNNFKLSKLRLIESERVKNCTFENIKNYYK